MILFTICNYTLQIRHATYWDSDRLTVIRLIIFTRDAFTCDFRLHGEVCILTYSQQVSVLQLTCSQLESNQIHAFHLLIIYIKKTINKQQCCTCTVLCVHHTCIKLFKQFNDEDITNVYTFVYTWYIHTLKLFSCDIYTECVNCSTGVSSLYLWCTQPQRGCLWSPHINPMASVNHSCGWSGGSVHPGLWCGYRGWNGLMSGC